jgi:outer membrane protein OmpA-like peptidoglycan-associated protein
LKLPQNSGRPAPLAVLVTAGSAFRLTAFAFALAAAALALAGPLACGPKTAKAPPSPPRLTAEAQRDQAFLLPVKQQQRWKYGEARPAPPKTPAYLLRSFTVAENNSTLNAEATGVCRDFAKIMAEKPKVRVLLLGLTDAYGEKLNADNLGLLRARAARDILVQQGVARDRTDIATIGAAGAVAQPEETIAQARDRRVEIWLMEE